MLSMVCTLYKLGQQNQTLTLNSATLYLIHNMCMKDPTKLKPKPATQIDLFLDQCLHWQLIKYLTIILLLKCALFIFKIASQFSKCL